MNITNKTSFTQTMTIGRYSDGSDRQDIEVTTFTIDVEDNSRTYRITFDHDPSDEEVQAKFDSKDYTDITDLTKLVDSLESRLSMAEDAINFMIMM